MTEEATLILDIAEEKMNKALEHLVEALLGIRAGKASPNVLKGIMVDYYGSQTPVSQVASVTVPDAKTILIQPWEKGMIPVIEKAILVSNIGLTPSNNGEHIRLSIPALTEERRRELVKQVKGEGETARVSVRNARREAVEAFKAAQKNGMPEDMAKDGGAEAQQADRGGVGREGERDNDRIAAVGSSVKSNGRVRESPAFRCLSLEEAGLWIFYLYPVFGKQARQGGLRETRTVEPVGFRVDSKTGRSQEIRTSQVVVGKGGALHVASVEENAFQDARFEYGSVHPALPENGVGGDVQKYRIVEDTLREGCRQSV